MAVDVQEEHAGQPGGAGGERHIEEELVHGLARGVEAAREGAERPHDKAGRRAKAHQGRKGDGVPERHGAGILHDTVPHELDLTAARQHRTRHENRQLPGVRLASGLRNETRGYAGEETRRDDGDNVQLCCPWESAHEGNASWRMDVASPPACVCRPPLDRPERARGLRDAAGLPDRSMILVFQCVLPHSGNSSCQHRCGR